MKSGSTWQNRHRRTTWPRTRGRPGPPPQVPPVSDWGRDGPPAPERALVVELLQERPPQLGPGPEQVGPGTGAALVGVLRQADRMAGEVDGVEVLDDPAAPQVLGNDVGGLDGIDFPGDWPRVVGR